MTEAARKVEEWMAAIGRGEIEVGEEITTDMSDFTYDEIGVFLGRALCVACSTPGDLVPLDETLRCPQCGTSIVKDEL